MNSIEKLLHNALENYGERLSNDGCNDQDVDLDDETRDFLIDMARQQCDEQYAKDMHDRIRKAGRAICTENHMVVGYLAHLVEAGKIAVVK